MEFYPGGAEAYDHVGCADGFHFLYILYLTLITGNRGRPFLLTYDWSGAIDHYGFNHTLWASSYANVRDNRRDRESYQGNSKNSNTKGTRVRIHTGRSTHLLKHVLILVTLYFHRTTLSHSSKFSDRRKTWRALRTFMRSVVVCKLSVRNARRKYIHRR